jgi:hypothetical protein
MSIYLEPKDFQEVCNITHAVLKRIVEITEKESIQIESLTDFTRKDLFPLVQNMTDKQLDTIVIWDALDALCDMGKIKLYRSEPWYLVVC